MREIKLRVFDEIHNKMIYFDFYNLSYDGSHSISELWEYISNGYKFMQFTGLQDKNKKDIYENDILLWNKKIFNFGRENHTQIKVIVRWDYYAFNQYDIYQNQIEIIGNIQQNPELLSK